MARYILHRFLAASGKWIVSAVVLLGAIEFSFVVLSGSDRHVWESGSYGDVPVEFSERVDGWLPLAMERGRNTLAALGLAYGGTLLVGYSWGILAARWRRFRAATWFGAVLYALACVPGFWFVILVGIYSYFAWQRPGFANEVVVEQGPDFLSWWHAAVVAFPVFTVASAWQLRAVSLAIEKEAARPYVRGLFFAGFPDDEIFYGNVLRQCVSSLVALFDRTLPLSLSLLVVVEWAFRYEGLGALLVDSVKSARYEGILLTGLAMSGAVCFVTAVRECAERMARSQ